jgi:hypothetical protein
MRLMLIVLGLCISGCASLSKGGGAVRQFSGNPLPECSYLGNVMGSGLSGVGGAAYEPAQRDLRNKTAELGGNFVRISSFGGALVKDVEGEAYLCPQSVQLVVTEPTPEQQIAQQMERQNDIAERQQRIDAFKKLAPPKQEAYQIKTNRPVNTTCNRYGNQVRCTSY